MGRTVLTNALATYRKETTQRVTFILPGKIMYINAFPRLLRMFDSGNLMHTLTTEYRGVHTFHSSYCLECDTKTPPEYREVLVHCVLNLFIANIKQVNDLTIGTSQMLLMSLQHIIQQSNTVMRMLLQANIILLNPFSFISVTLHFCKPLFFSVISRGINSRSYTDTWAHVCCDVVCEMFENLKYLLFSK